MGKTLGSNSQGKKRNNKIGWYRSNPESSDKLRAFLEGGKATRFKRKHVDPSIGDRFGELTYLGESGRSKKGDRLAKCQCSCGEFTNPSYSNLRAGRSRRCNRCSKKASKTTNTKWIKTYKSYGHIIPDI